MRYFKTDVYKRGLLWGAFWLLFLSADVLLADGEKESFFEQFVVAGGMIVYFVLIPMSVLAIFRIVELCFLIRRKRLLPDNIGVDLAIVCRQVGFTKVSSKIADRVDLVSRALHRASVHCRDGAADRKYVEHLAAEGLHDGAMRLLRKAELCNIIGNVAPMVGLFGTVYGMIQAFSILGISEGQTRHDQLAARISIALVTTFWGLLIAIPSLTFHGMIRTKIEALSSEAALELESLLRQLRLPVMLERPAGDTESTQEGSTLKQRSPRERFRTDTE